MYLEDNFPIECSQLMLIFTAGVQLAGSFSISRQHVAKVTDADVDCLAQRHLGVSETGVDPPPKSTFKRENDDKPSFVGYTTFRHSHFRNRQFLMKLCSFPGFSILLCGEDISMDTEDICF